MIEVRTKDKQFLPFAHWSDGWRMCWPDSDLPLTLWNIENVKDGDRVCIHEGPKIARYCEWLKANPAELAKHPWADDIMDMVHIAYTGGAGNVGLTDWPMLQTQSNRVIFAPDNDKPGRSAIPIISKAIRMPMTYLRVPDTFKIRWDFCDPIPKQYFTERNGHTVYKHDAPSFHNSSLRDLAH